MELVFVLVFIIIVSFLVSVLVATAVGAVAATFCRHFLACGHQTMIRPADSARFKLTLALSSDLLRSVIKLCNLGCLESGNVKHA